MQKFQINNRYGLEIVGNISIPENPKGIAFVVHGLGSSKESRQVMPLVDIFFAHGYSVVNFDATHSVGESGGSYEHARLGKHYEDLVDVIAWAKSQSWFIESFVLAGHSMGGYAVARYAEEYPDEVKAVFSFASVVSGKLSFDAMRKFHPFKLWRWRIFGYSFRMSKRKPGVLMRLPWAHMLERLDHDLLPRVSKLTMPVLIVVGELDESCPPGDQKILFEAIPSTHKELHIVPGTPHSFKEGEQLEKLKQIFDQWLKKI